MPVARRVEPARTVRMDATVVPVAIHPPTDSSLLLDAVRVLDRLLRQRRTRGGLHGVSPPRQAREAARDGDPPPRAAGTPRADARAIASCCSSPRRRRAMPRARSPIWSVCRRRPRAMRLRTQLTHAAAPRRAGDRSDDAARPPRRSRARRRETRVALRGACRRAREGSARRRITAIRSSSRRAARG